MKIVKSLLVISLLGSSLAHAGPAFDEAMMHWGLSGLDTEANYVSRLKIIALWLTDRIALYKLFAKTKGSEAEATVGADLDTMSRLIEENIKQQGDKRALEAIKDIKDYEKGHIPHKDYKVLYEYYYRKLQDVHNAAKLGSKKKLKGLDANFIELTDPKLWALEEEK